MRVKTFKASVDVNREFLANDPLMAEAMARNILRDQLSDVLRGPRGGRYDPMGEVTVSGPMEYDFTRNTLTIVGARKARYVRPSAAR